jgi:FkbM family methyltransferase
MSILSQMFDLVLNVFLILRKEKIQSRRELASTYIRLKTKGMLAKALGIKLTRERIFGFDLSFFDYSILVAMFEDIFIQKDYYFATKEERPLIIDCGSNMGMSLVFFKKFYPKSRIISFEPDGKTFEVLKRNVETNHLESVELNNKAVYDRSGTIDFYYDSKKPGSGLMSTMKERITNGAAEKVECVPLSGYIKGSVDFLKIDIEGAEGIVMEEMASKDKLRLVKGMIIEYHHHVNPKEDGLSKILKMLEDTGFGYQISTFLYHMRTFAKVHEKNKFEDIMVYAYKKV